MKNFKRIISLLLCISVVLSFQTSFTVMAQDGEEFPEKVSGEDYLIDEDFEGTEYDITWTDVKNGTAGVSGEEGNKSFQLSRPAGTPKADKTTAFIDLANGEDSISGIYALEADIASASATINFRIRGAGGSQYVNNTLHSNGNLGINGASNNDFTDCTGMVNLKFLFYTEQGLYSAWVNGEKVIDKAASKAATNIKDIYIYMEHATNAQVTTLDNLKFYKAYPLEEDRVDMDKAWLTEEEIITGTIVESFTLPQRGMFGSYLRWTSSDSEVISISGENATVTLPPTETTVALTAQFSADGESWNDAADYKKELTFTVAAGESSGDGDNNDDNNDDDDDDDNNDEPVVETLPGTLIDGKALIDEDFEGNEYDISWTEPSYGSIGVYGEEGSKSLQLIREAQTPKANKTATIIDLANGEDSLSGVYALEADIASSSATINFRIRGAGGSQYVNNTLHANGNLGINGASNNDFTGCTGTVNLKFLFYTEQGLYSAWVNGEKVIDKAASKAATNIKDIYIYMEHATNAQVTTLDNLKFYKAHPLEEDRVAMDKAWLTEEEISTGKIVESFTLPQRGMFGSYLRWTSSDSEVISISGENATVTLPADETTVTLTAQFSVDGESWNDTADYKKELTFTVAAGESSGDDDDDDDDEPVVETVPGDLIEGEALIDEDFEGTEYDIVWEDAKNGSIGVYGEEGSKNLQLRREAQTPKANKTSTIIDLANGENSVNGIYALEADIASSSATINFRIRGAGEKQYVNVTLHSNGNLGINGATNNSFTGCTGTVNLKFLFYTQAGLYSAWVNGEQVIDKAASKDATNIKDIYIYMEHATNAQVTTLDNLKFYKARMFSADNVAQMDALYLDSVIDTEATLSENYTLPETVYGSSVEWEITEDAADVAQIGAGGKVVEITPASSDATFTLKATISKEGFESVVKTYTFTVVKAVAPQPLPESLRQGNYIINEQFAGNTSSTLWNKDVTQLLSDEMLKIIPADGDTAEHELYLDEGKTGLKGVYALEADVRCNLKTFRMFVVGSDGRLVGVTLNKAKLGITGATVDENGNSTDANSYSASNDSYLDGVTLRFLFYTEAGKFSVWADDVKILDMADAVAAKDIVALQFQLPDAGADDPTNSQVATVDNIKFYKAIPYEIDQTQIDAAYITKDVLTDDTDAALAEGKVSKDLTLPSVGEYGSFIKWSINPANAEYAVLDGNTVRITRAEGNPGFTLQAEFNLEDGVWNDETSVKKSFEFNVAAPHTDVIVTSSRPKAESGYIIEDALTSKNKVIVSNGRVEESAEGIVIDNGDKFSYMLGKDGSTYSDLLAINFKVKGIGSTFSLYDDLDTKVFSLSMTDDGLCVSARSDNERESLRDAAGLFLVKSGVTEADITIVADPISGLFSVWYGEDELIANARLGADDCSRLEYWFVEHNGSGSATVSDLKVYYPTMDNYSALCFDRAAITLETLTWHQATADNGNILLVDDIKLPAAGRAGSVITWNSSDSDVINVNGVKGIVTQSENENHDVKVSATLTYNGENMNLSPVEFDFTVPKGIEYEQPEVKELVYEETFKDNNVLTAWSHSPSVGQIYVKNERLYIKRNTQVEASATKTYFYFDKSQQSKRGVLGFDVTLWNKKKTMKFKIEGVSDDIIFSNITLNPSGGTATYRDENGTIKSVSLDCTDRMKLSFLFNTDEETFSLWVDGELVLENVKTETENTSAGIKRIYTYINAEGEQEAQIDDIRFYEAYPLNADRIELDKKWLMENSGRLANENDPMLRFGMISENLSLPVRGEYGTYIEWSSSDPAITIDGTTGVINSVTLPTPVTLTARLSLDGVDYDENNKLEIPFVVSSNSVSDDGTAVETVLSMLTLESITPYEDLTDGGVKRSLSLPIEDIYGCNISWSSDNTYYIDNVGRVTRPRYDENDVTVNLTATVSRGDASGTVTIPVVVLKDKEFTDPQHMTDKEFFGEWDGTQWITESKFDYENVEGLSKVEAAVKNGDYALAKEELLAYFRTDRNVSNFEAPSRNTGWANMVTDDFQHLQTTMYYRGSMMMGSEWGSYSTSLKTSEITSGSQICFTVRAWYNEDSYAEIAKHTADPDKRPMLELTIDGTTRVFPAIDSVTVRAGDYKDVNYSSDEYLKVSNYGDFTGDGLYETYLKFDVSSVTGEAVSRARLVLYGHSSTPQEKRLIVLYHNDNTWNGETLTWGDITQLVYSYNGLGDSGDSDSGLPDSSVFPMERWTTFIEANNSYGQISRFNAFSVIAYEYALSKDEKYAYEAMKIMQDFISTTGGFTGNGTSNKSRGVFKTSWDHGEGGELKRGAYDTTLSSAIRATNWLNAMKVFVNSEYMTPDFLTAVLKSVWDTADYLTVYNSGKGNWMNTEMQGLQAVADNVPEFKERDDWTTKANIFLAIQLFNNTFEDGSYIESTESYGHGSLKAYIGIKRDLMAKGIDVNEICKEFIGTEDAKGHIINDTYDERLIKMAYYQILMYTPDGNSIQYGDSGYGTRNAHTWDDVYRWFDDEELEYIATYGKAGTKPSWTSKTFYDSGITTLRGSWAKNSPYLFTNVRGGGGHGHRDYNSITLAGYGNMLIADSGYFEYDTTDDYRQYGVSTEAHNTVVVNDTNQTSSYHSKTNPAPSTGTIHEFVTNSAYDYLQQSTPNNFSFGTHMRTITYLKPDIFIVSDRMMPKEGNVGNNNYKQTWHMHPEANISIDPENKKIRSNFEEDGNVVLVSANDNTELKLKDGWCAKLYAKVEDAPYAYFEANDSGETYLDTVIMTMPEGRNDDVNATKIETGANATALKIEFTQSRETYTGYYLLSYDGLGADFGPFTTDAQMAYVQFDQSGALNRVMLSGGTYIKEKESGKVIFKADAQQSAVSVDFSNREMMVEGDETALSSATIKSYENMSGLYINNEPYNYDLIDGYVTNIGSGSILSGENMNETEIGGVVGNKPSSGSESAGGGGGGGGGSESESEKTEPDTEKDTEEKEENTESIPVFTDVQNHWAKSYIGDLQKKGIVNGGEKGLFNPDNQITRAEFIAMVTRSMNYEETEFKNVFSDVKETDWYAQNISQAISEGLISKDVFFRPNAPITRQEMAKIISQAKKLDRTYNPSSEILEKYADSDLVSEWAKEYVSLITMSGLMQGRDSGFCPHDNSTRAEAATVISRMLNE